MTALLARYHRLARSDDPDQRALAERQLIRLEPRSRSPRASSSWRHVPLADLFAELNEIHTRGDDRLETGHEPVHTSRSGRCVVVDPALGLWYCRSCRRGGDAASFLAASRDWSRRRAELWLVLQYGMGDRVA
ncbi:MAG: hypothetical protein IT304_04400 [Dehalococcoidia bacterium]|nr:hypothetical protein [Dehalococcoidia bacterium]